MTRSTTRRSQTIERTRNIDMLIRRRNRLAERVVNWDKGDVGYTKGELKALNWAIRVLQAAERQGILKDLEAL